MYVTSRRDRECMQSVHMRIYTTVIGDRCVFNLKAIRVICYDTISVAFLFPNRFQTALFFSCFELHVGNDMYM